MLLLLSFLAWPTVMNDTGCAACDPSATCVIMEERALCVCPEHYEDANGDGSLCLFDWT